jgi:C1A family cysteine protease
MNPIKRKYDWRPDRPDPRDYGYAIPPIHAAGNLPARVDLRPHCPPVYDQGDLGACTGNALAGLFQFLQMSLGVPSWIPSRLFIYYGERAIEGDVGQDSGASIRDGMTILEQKGVCPETLWPYEIARFAVKPPSQAYHTAFHHKIRLYQRLNNLNLVALKSCLASGFPFVFGFTVYESFESPEVAKTGVAPLPAPKENALGGHAVMAVGYDDASQVFLVRNSWGPDWGQAGYFTIPYAYLTSATLANDFWTARKAV